VRGLMKSCGADLRVGKTISSEPSDVRLLECKHAAMTYPQPRDLVVGLQRRLEQHCACAAVGPRLARLAHADVWIGGRFVEPGSRKRLLAAAVQERDQPLETVWPSAARLIHRFNARRRSPRFHRLRQVRTTPGTGRSRDWPDVTPVTSRAAASLPSHDARLDSVTSWPLGWSGGRRKQSSWSVEMPLKVQPQGSRACHE
jgi:hypothetical protein